MMIVDRVVDGEHVVLYMKVMVVVVACRPLEELRLRYGTLAM